MLAVIAGIVLSICLAAAGKARQADGFAGCEKGPDKAPV
jgi:hypothetical protein